MALSKIKTNSIANDAITSAKLATGGIATVDMADGSVTSLKILDGAIATADIADAAITPAKLSTGGLYWNTSSNVGIGTSSPAQKLDVTGNVAISGQIMAGTATTYSDGSIGTPRLQWHAKTGTYAGAVSISDTTSNLNHWVLRNPNGNIADFGTNGTSLVIGTASTERIRINSSGNVGIGTGSEALYSDLSVRYVGGGGSGSLSIASPAGGGGASYILMGNQDSGGASGPAMIASSNRSISFGVGTSYASRSGGTFTNYLTINDNGTLAHYNSASASVLPAYMCRAWVNFNGVGTVSIRGSSNVSSITDAGVGSYTMNFSTAMPDANYSAPASINGGSVVSGAILEINAYNAGSVGVRGMNGTSSYSNTDFYNFSVAIFR